MENSKVQRSYKDGFPAEVCSESDFEKVIALAGAVLQLGKNIMSKELELGDNKHEKMLLIF